MEKMNKKERLRELGLLRQTSCFEGFNNLAAYHIGAYECEHVSPYTKSAGNVNSLIVFVLQDWASHESLSRDMDLEVAQHGYTLSQPTNVNLIDLLSRHFGLILSEVYVTNLFPFIKSGGDSANIPMRYLRQAARVFGIAQIEIIRPAMVVSFGLQVFNALRSEFGHRQVANLKTGINNPFRTEFTEYRCQSHPGALGKINRNHRGSVEEDWAAMASAFRNLAESEGP